MPLIITHTRNYLQPNNCATVFPLKPLIIQTLFIQENCTPQHSGSNYSTPRKKNINNLLLKTSFII